MVSACASSGSKAPTNKSDSNTAINSARPALESEAIDKAMRDALAAAEVSGNKQEVIATLAQIQARNPNDAIIATRYARELREDDQMMSAKRILEPFVNKENPNVEALTEMAMTEISLGDFEEAKRHALKSTVINPKNARGFLALGTSQDALQDHPNAELSFRQGLKNWQGDPSPILNNLALNLASQGALEESLSLLERAIKISPKRMELERNRRIIATLLETSGPRAPAPNKKPDIKIPEAAKPVAPKPVVQTPAPVAAKPAPVKAATSAKTQVKKVTAPEVKTNIKLKPIVNE